MAMRDGAAMMPISRRKGDMQKMRDRLRGELTAASHLSRTWAKSRSADDFILANRYNVEREISCGEHTAGMECFRPMKRRYCHWWPAFRSSSDSLSCPCSGESCVIHSPMRSRSNSSSPIRCNIDGPPDVVGSIFSATPYSPRRDLCEG